MKRKPTGTIVAYQPDLFGGAGIQRPALTDNRTTELRQARLEMMANGASTIFDAIQDQEERGNQ